MAEHRIESKTKGLPYDTCERCKFFKGCKNFNNTEYARTVRCSEFKIAKD